MMLFRDRDHAGQLLAQALEGERLERPVIYALPRGGVPVARRIADNLGAPLDLILVRKIGVPWQPEIAAAAVADGGRPEIVFNEGVMIAHGLTRDTVEQLAVQELHEIERRRQLYLKHLPFIDVRDRDAIIVDDGIATGATFRCALQAIRRRSPARIIAAIPVAPADKAHELARLVDRLVCLAMPERLGAISQYYGDFSQLTDDHVVRLLGHGKGRTDDAQQEDSLRS